MDLIALLAIDQVFSGSCTGRVDQHQYRWKHCNALTSSVSPNWCFSQTFSSRSLLAKCMYVGFIGTFLFCLTINIGLPKVFTQLLHLRFDQHRPQRGPNCCYRWLPVACMSSSRCPLVSSAPSSTWSSWRPSRTATAYTQSHLTSWFAVWYINLFSNVHICPIIFNGRYIGCWYTYTKHPPDLYVLSFFNILLYMA